MMRARLLLRCVCVLGVGPGVYGMQEYGGPETIAGCEEFGENQRASFEPSEELRQGDKTLAEKLRQPSRLWVTGQLLLDLLDSLAEQLETAVHVDEAAVTEAGIRLDIISVDAVPVGLTRRSTLRLVLDEQGLGYTMCDDGLTVSTKEAAKARWDSRFQDGAARPRPDDLESQSLDVRRETAFLAGQMRIDAETWVEPLLRATNDSDRFVRGDAVYALGELGPKAAQAIKRLVSMVRTGDVAPVAARALGKIGPAAAPHLLVLLQGSRFRLVSDAAAAFRVMGPSAKPFVPDLLDALRRFSTNTLVRDAIAQAVNQIDPQGAIASLQRMLGSNEVSVRAAAAFTLGGLQTPDRRAVEALATALRDENASVRREAADALSRIGPAAGVALPMLELAAEDSDSTVSSRARIAIRAIRPKSLDEKLRDQSDAWTMVRPRLAHMLDDILKEADRSFAVDDVALSKTGVDWAALRSDVMIEGINHVSAVRFLLDEHDLGCFNAAPCVITTRDLAKEKVTFVREWAFQLHPDGLRSEVLGIRRVVAFASGEIALDPETWIEDLEQAVGDEDLEVRFDATYAIGQLGEAGAAASGKLMAVLRNEDDPMWAAAAHALGRIGSRTLQQQFVAVEDADPKVISGAARALSVSGLRARDAIPNMIESVQRRPEDNLLRYEVAKAIARIDGLASVPLLLDLLTADEPAPRSFAAFTIGEIALWQLAHPGDIQLIGRECVQPLANALGDSDARVRRNAAYALSKLGARAALPALRTACGDNDIEVRCWAERAVRDIERAQAKEKNTRYEGRPEEASRVR